MVFDNFPSDPFDGEIGEMLLLTPDLFALFGADGRLHAANPAFCKAYHCDPTERQFWRDIMRANFEQSRGPVIKTDDIEAWLTDADGRRGTLPYRSFEAEFHDGRWILITETVCPQGRLLFQGTDIASMRTESRTLRVERDIARRNSWTDQLTGVPNRRYVMEQLETWFHEQANRQHFGNHALAVIDLDHFKAINDHYGHAIGDDVLVSFSRKAVRSIRVQDLFGRIGGEEFLLFMPNCDLISADRRLNILLSDVADMIVSSTHPELRCSFSAGLVQIRSDKDIHHAIRRADRLLYDAKFAGRARVQNEDVPLHVGNPRLQQPEPYFRDGMFVKT